MIYILTRLFAFIFSFILLAILELEFEWNKRTQKKWQRWQANLTLLVIDIIALRIVLPSGIIGLSIWYKKNNLGIFNWLSWNPVLEFIIAILLLDLAIYFQHILFHRYSVLWKIHRVHHTDLELDLTTALRFHPLEIIISTIYKLIIIMFIGASPLTVLIFEIILNSISMFNHANLFIPERQEKTIRRVIVSPQMHLIHHSVLREESDSNYGFNFSFWDRIFKTYTDKFSSTPFIGQRIFRQENDQRIWSLLLQPLRKK